MANNTSNDLVLGAGELHFAQFLPGTQTPGGYRPLGNCPEFKTALERQMKEHFNSQRGVKEKDAEFTLGVKHSGSITCDNVSAANLAVFFLGSASTLTVSGSTDVVETIAVGAQGVFYQLGVTAAAPSGARKVTSVVVTDGEVVPTTYALGTDYTVNGDLGQIAVVAGGGIAADSNMEVTYDITAHTREVIISSTTAIEGALKFISYNNAGSQRDAFFPWVIFTPNGDISLVTDEEFLTISLSVELLSLGDLECVYLDGRPVTA
jgi:hypothetical protein